jgi:hypothetical protein
MLQGRASAHALAAVVLAVAASCVPTTQFDEPLLVDTPRAARVEVPVAVDTQSPPSDAPAVVLVVLDGVRWQDVFVPENTPVLHRMISERGAAIGASGHGPTMSASGPAFVSLPGYSEIFTGRRAHGCADNDCGRARTRTVFDEVARVEGSPGAVGVFSSWERIERAASPGQGAFVLSAGRSVRWHEDELLEDPGVAATLQEGAKADAFPGYGDFRPDLLTGAVALRYLEQRRPRLLYMGLGEPDEYAHRGDFPGYLASLRAADAIVGAVFETLDRMGERGKRTTVLVTTDHGRGADWRHHGKEMPESARVWLFAGGEGIGARGLVHSVRSHRLSDVAPTVRALLDMPSDAAPSAGAPIDELLAASPVLSVGSLR